MLPPSPALPPFTLRVLCPTPHHADGDINRASTNPTTISTAATTIMTTYHLPFTMALAIHPSQQLNAMWVPAGDCPSKTSCGRSLDARFAEISGKPESPTVSANAWVGRVL
ncbi:MAG TPA: hypothetical protein VIH75_18955 [Candidatus Sulfotelmatobacter sp.]